EGNIRSGLRLADGAMPRVPAHAGPRSERISPNRLEATTTSKRSGLKTNRAARISIWYWSHLTSGYCPAISLTLSSQKGMLMEIQLELVAEVRCFLGRRCANSKAYFKILSTPFRVKTDCCSTTSRSVCSNIFPPILE